MTQIQPHLQHPIDSPTYGSIYQQNIIWGDMDAFGHLNNVMYFRYIESARIDYLNSINALELTNLIPVLGQTACQYLSPVTYPDTFLIGCNITDIRQSGFKMTYDLYSTKQKKIVANAEAIIVIYNNQTQSKAPIPTVIKDAIADLQRTTLLKLPV